MSGWKNYDFYDPKCWKAFWDVWNSEYVQDELEECMEGWCFHEKKAGTTWTRGEPLWELSLTDFWCRRISKLAEKEVDSIVNPFDEYKKLMKIKGFPAPEYFEELLFTNQDLYDNLNKAWFEKINEIEKKYYPAPDSPDALMMIRGKNYLTDAFCAAVEELFPNDTIIVKNSAEKGKQENRIFIKEKKILFDLYDSFFSKNCNDVPFLETEEGKKFIVRYFTPDGDIIAHSSDSEYDSSVTEYDSEYDSSATEYDSEYDSEYDISDSEDENLEPIV